MADANGADTSGAASGAWRRSTSTARGSYSSCHDAKLYLDQVLAEQEILKAKASNCPPPYVSWKDAVGKSVESVFPVT